MSTQGKQQTLLTFRVGPVLCVAPSLCVSAIISPPKLTHPPGSNDSQPGIFRHNSAIVRVIDLRQKFGIDDEDQTQPGHLIITTLAEEHIAFWVDKIHDVFDFPSEGWGALPPYLPRGIFSRTLLLKQSIHLYSEFEKLATIQGQGYLKHYVAHLKQQTEKEQQTQTSIPTSSIREIPSTTASSSSTQNSNTTDTHNPETEILKKTGIDNKHSVQPVKKEQPYIHNERTPSLSQSVSSSVPGQKTSGHTPKSFSADKTKHQQNPATSLSSSATVTSTYTENKTTTQTGFKTSSQSNSSSLRNKPLPENSNKEITRHNETISTESSGWFSLIIILLILSVSFGSIYFLLTPEKNTRIKDVSITAGETTYEENYFQDKLSETNSINTVSAAKDFSAENKIPVAENMPHVNLPADTTSPDTTHYAEITRSQDEITIDIVNIETKENTPSEPETAENSQPTGNEKQDLTPGNSIKPDTIKNELPVTEHNVKKENITREIIHIVVKGDTLWDIAKRYVNNPFLYPELARLSKIKNPHRIYPGNRVKIRFVNK